MTRKLLRRNYQPDNNKINENNSGHQASTTTTMATVSSNNPPIEIPPILSSLFSTTTTNDNNNNHETNTTPEPVLNPLKILIINPNTSTHMTTALNPAVHSLGYTLSNVHFEYFTCPSSATGSVASINSPDDAAASAQACLPSLKPLLADHDAFLVACYSHHPLVQMVRAECDALDRGRKYVTGIFEASVTASLNLVAASGDRVGFGIVSTGKVWEEALAHAVDGFLGLAGNQSERFLGCQTTGLNASELHDLPALQVREKMMLATKRLVVDGRGRGVAVRAVCLGCAGMVGLEEAVRAALVEELGRDDGVKVAIVDGVKAGVGELVLLARGGF